MQSRMGGAASKKDSSKQENKKNKQPSNKEKKSRKANKKNDEASSNTTRSNVRESNSVMASPSQKAAASQNATPKKRKVKILPRAENAEEVRQTWCQTILDKGVDSLRAEFMTVEDNYNVDFSTFSKPENADKNRNADLLCLEATRIRLPNNEYIHANYVGTMHNATRFICTQGPLETTVCSFWTMVLSEKCEAIVMLCKTAETQGSMCCPYFSEDAGGSMTFADAYKVFTHEKTTMKDFETIARYKVSIKPLKQKDLPRHRAIIYQWLDWPSFGMPEPNLAAMNLLQSVRGSSFPVVVHCNEGVGRTGVIALIEQFYELMMLGQNCSDGARVLRDLRAQRWGSVETDMQYVFVYRVLFHYFMHRKTIEMSQNLLQWIDDYDAMHKKFVQAEKENPQKPVRKRLPMPLAITPRTPPSPGPDPGPGHGMTGTGGGFSPDPPPLVSTMLGPQF